MEIVKIIFFLEKGDFTSFRWGTFMTFLIQNTGERKYLDQKCNKTRFLKLLQSWYVQGSLLSLAHHVAALPFLNVRHHKGRNDSSLDVEDVNWFIHFGVKLSACDTMEGELQRVSGWNKERKTWSEGLWEAVLVWVHTNAWFWICNAGSWYKFYNTFDGFQGKESIEDANTNLQFLCHPAEAPAVSQCL